MLRQKRGSVMLAVKTFLFVLLSSNAVLAGQLKDAPFVRAIYEMVKDDKNPIFDKYSTDIFKPLKGPFYQHLSRSSDPRSVHLAENGFSERKSYDEDIALYPPLRESQVILIKGETWPMAHDIDMVDFMEALLQLHLDDKKNEFIFHDEEILPSHHKHGIPVDFSERIRLAEYQRPRIFLSFFIDVYRVLLELVKSCKSSGQYTTNPEHCAGFFTSYDHLLATYTELVCKYLTAVGGYDVDHICPNLCLPRGNPLWQPTEEQQISIDVCGQIRFAMPGTCRIYGKGIYDHEFICECITSAYHWEVGPGQLVLSRFPQCEPRDTQFEKLAPGASEIVKCSRGELSYFCNIGGSVECVFENLRERIRGKNLTVTKTSLWPTCICKEGYAGVRCDRRFSICEDSLSIPEKELNELKKKIPGLPEVITANWLCEGYVPGADCLPDYSPKKKYKYRCECRQGSKRDWNYRDLDNCRLRSISQDNYVEETMTCPLGYAGDYCDRTINAWSKWSEWGECYPYCGSHRIRSRRRLCLGDFGCVGSTYATEKCTPSPCTELRESERNTKKLIYQPQYLENGGFYIPSLKESIFLITAFTLGVQIVAVALHVCIFWKTEGRKARASKNAEN